MNELKKLEAEAHKLVESVSNSPKERYKLRLKFYHKYGDARNPEKDGLGNSELAFMKWEMRRGVLNPIKDESPGSPWWRVVNGHFIYLSSLAALIHEAEYTTDEISLPVKHWLDYINNPNEQTWY